MVYMTCSAISWTFNKKETFVNKDETFVNKDETLHTKPKTETVLMFTCSPGTCPVVSHQ